MTAGAEYAVARYFFADLGKAEVQGETDGFVKLIASPGSCEILGAAARPEASELIHELAAGIDFRATARDLLQIPLIPPHPQRDMDLPRRGAGDALIIPGPEKWRTHGTIVDTAGTGSNSGWCSVNRTHRHPKARHNPTITEPGNPAPPKNNLWQM